ncbi:uncharacterized protein LOC129606208 isoform X2 [Condylostylus longicornis]|nr:uncharacterized protein LOC129606208 isoform X2 [Condylostylus longicornis]XP_055372349.1 uncharacterized protein LOC129606208 isoform X2 [Condylostylus longicornis]
MKQKIKADIIEQKLELQRRAQEEEIKRQQEIINRLKEHEKICYNLYVFGVKPFKEYIKKPYRINGYIEKQGNEHDTNENHKPNYDSINVKLQQQQQQSQNHNASEPIIYLFILVLIYFLMKSASDITQHFKQKSKQKDDSSRRCSLQEYAERKNSKAKFANHRSISVDTQKITPILSLQFDEKRRQSVASGLSIEPGVSSRPLNGPGYRPLPLLRRGSVPAFSYHASSPLNPLLRRPSMDSFSEGESSPEVKRRVRMIQRH